MEGHWAQSIDWDSMNDADEALMTSPRTPAILSGTFHCKSALRDHSSNMKLFLYRESFRLLSSVVGPCPYNDEALLLLPDLWNCFYHGTHDLNRDFDIERSRVHSKGSVAFLRWADYTMKDITAGSILEEVINVEANIWGVEHVTGSRLHRDVYLPAISRVRRSLYLQYYLNLVLICMNHTPSEVRSDVTVVLPGICSPVDESLYQVQFNEELYCLVSKNAVFVHTSCYEQILQKDVFLNLCDKISERINVSLGSIVISQMAAIRYPDDQDHPDRTMSAIVESIIKWGDSLLYAFRNKAYDLIGTYEAFCVSAILLHDDPLIWDHNEFQRNLLNDISENEPALHTAATALTSILNVLNPSQLSEVHGLWRIWGHPIIDLEGGLRKMENTCLRQAHVDPKETAVGHRTFKYILFTNYYNKHGHYPLSNMTSDETFNLYKEHLTDRDIMDYTAGIENYDETVYLHRQLRAEAKLEDQNSLYHHADWDQVILLQCFQVPQSINLATMIKDKAISQTRSELISSVKMRNSVFDSTNRRGVLKWLTEQTLRLKYFLTGIDESGLDEDDRIIGLYPKERELKTKARFFSLMSYKMRMYITATEEMLGKYFLPYFPMITMSDTLLNMIIRLYNMTTHIGARGSSVTYSMNIDFSKWNQNMRERTNGHIFSDIDRVLGFRKLISRTHDIFRNSYLYLCSGEYIPQIVRGALTAMSPYSRIGDESGKEGLRQKGWTITTVCDIVSLAFSHGVKIELIGGGDNQVLTVTISSKGATVAQRSEEQRMKAKEKMIKFRDALAAKMSRRGLPLKLEETWISHRLLMYNKIMYLDGVPLPGRLKVISRLFSNSNEGISTLGNITSTLGTGFQSLSAKDFDPILAWVISRWLLFINLAQYYLCNPMNGSRRFDRSMLTAYSRMRSGCKLFGREEIREGVERQKFLLGFSVNRVLSLEDLFLVCTYYHKVLGGPGIGTPLAYIMKGFPDPLSEALTFNYMIIKSGLQSSLRDKIEKLTSVKKANVYHWEHLLEDPVAVNHDAPAHGIAALRSQASLVMRNATIRNQAFKELISIGDTDYLRELSDKLCKSSVLEPRLLHDIVGSTIPGYVNTILSKVDQSSTLNKLASNVDVIGEIYEAEMKYMMYLAKKINVKEGHTPGVCPTEDARGLRNMTWGKKIVGVTTPHPYAYLTMTHHTNQSPECDHNYISVYIKRAQHLSRMKRGQFTPYFGSYTAEKFKTGVLASAYGDEDVLKRALKIQKLLGWRYQRGSVMFDIIQGILRCVTNADPDKFLPTVEEITGDVEHRYHDMATKHGGIPTNLTRDLTFVSCNTSTFIDHSKGAANETIHFQAAIIFSGVLASLMSSGKERVSQLIHFHEHCPHCIKPIEHVEDESGTIQNVALTSCPENPLMYILEEEIPVHYHNVISFVRDQEKRQREHRRIGHNDKFVTFSESNARSSWLLLAVTSLLLSKMKRSAEVLIIKKMSIMELLMTVRCTLILSKMKAGKPVKPITLCDCKDVLEEWCNLLSTILAEPCMMTHLGSIGFCATSSRDSVPQAIFTLLESEAECRMGLFSGAVCKYQDPEYKMSKALLISQVVPTIQTCQLCVKYWWAISQSKTHETCHLHMYELPEISYHLYSLDKLSRYAGLAKSSEDVLGKRKHNSIFQSIKKHRLSTTTMRVRLRRGLFLYQQMEFENEIISHINCQWVKNKISCSGPYVGQKFSGNDRFQVPGLFGVDYVPSAVGEVLGIVQSILMVYFQNKKNEEMVHVGFSVPQDHMKLGIYHKAFNMMKGLILPGSSQIMLHLLIEDIKDLESANMSIISELEYGARDTRQDKKVPPGVLVKQMGEHSLELGSLAEELDALMLRNPSSLLHVGSSSNARVYLMCDSDSCFTVMMEYQDIYHNNSLNKKVVMHTPVESLSHPYPIVLELKEGKEDHILSQDLLIRHLGSTRPVFNTEASADIVNTISPGSLVSLTHDLYLECAGKVTLIPSEETYLAIRTNLSSYLMLLVLRYQRNAKLSWKSSHVISMIIGLDIITSTDPGPLLREYSSTVGTSFSRKTYKEIILYKRRMGDRPPGDLINPTAGSIGNDIAATYAEMRKFITCTWRVAREYRRKISI